MQKSHHQKQTKFESKARRAPSRQRHQKVDRAKDQDWKRDIGTINSSRTEMAC